MDEKYLVMIDISKKQEYIYSSNNLKDIIGASYIIKYVSEFLGRDILKSMINGREIKYYNYENQNGKIVYDKGGNSIFILSEDEKDKFIEYFSKVAYVMFPGLNFNIVETKFNPMRDSIVKALHTLEHKLVVKKNTAEPQGSLLRGSLSFGFTIKCKHSGMPSGYEYLELLESVFGKDGNINYEKASLSESTIVKRAMFYLLDPYSKMNWKDNAELSSNDRRNNIRRILNEAPYYKDNDILNINIGKNVSILNYIHEFYYHIQKSKGFQDIKTVIVTNDIDEYMNQESTRIHGVVTADGNGMGKLFKNLDDEFSKKISDLILNENIEEKILKENLDYIKLKQDISRSVGELYEKALNDTSSELINYLSKDKNDKDILTLPLRILVSAGDDLTFIIGGKYMLAYIKRFLDKVESPNITFGIGSVLIDSKYPLYKAIEKASKLESKSKSLSYLMDKKSEKDDSSKKRSASIISYNLFRGDIDDRGSDNLYINESDEWIKEKLELVNRGGETCKISNKFSYNTLLESINTFNEKNKSERNSLKTELVGLYKNDPFYIKEFMFTHKFNEKSLVDDQSFFDSRDNSECMELFKDVFELSNYYERFIEGGNQNE